MKRIIAVALACSVVPADTMAQNTSPDVKLDVTLDRADWLYKAGDTARFSVSLTRGGVPVSGAKVVVQVGRERMPPMSTDTIDVGAQGQMIKATLAKPGFLRAIAVAELGGMTYRDMATAAFSPDSIMSATTMPADFEQFWKTTVASARRTPLDPVMTLMPQRSTADVDVYHVSFQNDRAGSRLYGILSMPKRAGKFPALLNVPGAGVRPLFPDTSMAKRGVINLRIGIHGIPVDRDSLLYNALSATALSRYWSYGVESRDNYYYKRVFAGLVRAGDFIFSLPQFDGKNYVVQGSSQGGGLAIVTGYLDNRVKAIAVSYPAMADHFGWLDGRPGGWPHIFSDTAGVRAIPEKMETLRYYDVVNFARLLKVPGLYTWGYNDLIVPPTASYVAYNAVSAPKERVIWPDTGHNNVPAQSQRIRAWILENLGMR